MAADSLSKQIIRHLQSKNDHTDNLHSLLAAIPVTKHTLNAELYRLQREGVVGKVQDIPPVWTIRQGNSAVPAGRTRALGKHPRLPLKTRGRGRGRGSGRPVGSAVNRTKPVNKDSIRKILNYMQMRKEPVKSIEVAKAVGFSTSSEVNNTLYFMQKKQLVIFQEGPPPRWCIQGNSPAVREITGGLRGRNSGSVIPSGVIPPFQDTSLFGEKTYTESESDTETNMQTNTVIDMFPVLDKEQQDQASGGESPISSLFSFGKNVTREGMNHQASPNPGRSDSDNSSEETEIPEHSIFSSQFPTEMTSPPVLTKTESCCIRQSLPHFKESFPEHAHLDDKSFPNRLSPEIVEVNMSPVMPSLSPQVRLSENEINKNCGIEANPNKAALLNNGLKQSDSLTDADRLLKELMSCPLGTAASFVLASKMKIDTNKVEELLEELQQKKYVRFSTNVWVLSPSGEEYIKGKTNIVGSSVSVTPMPPPPRPKNIHSGPPPPPRALMEMKGQMVSKPGNHNYISPNEVELLNRKTKDSSSESDSQFSFASSQSRSSVPVTRPPGAYPFSSSFSQTSSQSGVSGLFMSQPSTNQSHLQSTPVPLMSMNLTRPTLRSPMADLLNAVSKIPSLSSAEVPGFYQGNSAGFSVMNNSSSQPMSTGNFQTQSALQSQSRQGPVARPGNFTTEPRQTQTREKFKPPATPADIVRGLKQAEISPRRETPQEVSFSSSSASGGMVKTMTLSEFRKKVLSENEDLEPMSLPANHSEMWQYGNQLRTGPQHGSVTSFDQEHQSLPVIPTQTMTGTGIKLELNLESFSPLNKNPVSALMEYAQSRKQEARIEVLSQRGSSHKPVFQMAAFIGGRQFPTITCHNKKDGRKEAADIALRQLTAEGLFHKDSEAKTSKISVPPASMTHFDKMAALTHQCFTAIVSQIKLDSFAGRKVIAGLVMKRSPDDLGVVVSLGTGNRCITGPQLSLEGNTVNDSHAEIITRRGFIRFLYKQLLEYDPTKRSHLFEKTSSGKLRIKTGISFHLYISTAPCGDGALFSPRDVASNNIQLDNSTEHNPTFSSNVQGILRTKVEGGEGTIPIEPGFSGQTYDGIMRGERLRTMSCSDKICRWNVVGLQGALLSHFLEPVYLESLTLGFLFDPGHLCRAVCCRVGKGETDVDSQLPGVYRLNHPRLGRVTACDPPREVQKTKAISINWCYGDEQPEVTDGTLGLCNTGLEKTFFSRCTKRNFYTSFKKLCEKFGCRDCLQAESYKEAKMMAADFQRAREVMLQRFKENKFGKWVSKPVEEEMFG